MHVSGKFKVNYDDQLWDVVDRISSTLSKFDLAINELDGGDGFNEYEIVPKQFTKEKETAYEYEVLFDSTPECSIQIHGWYPIATNRIVKPENIEKYISDGILRRIKK